MPLEVVNARRSKPNLVKAKRLNIALRVGSTCLAQRGCKCKQPQNQDNPFWSLIDVKLSCRASMRVVFTFSL